jgi:two-component system cell cycle sensor histidine kinase/response regulator CckA
MAPREDGHQKDEPSAGDQRREAIKEFAGGVAHDFSNPLQAILGFAELIRSQHRDDPELLDCVEEIITASKRAGTMVRQLLVISQQHELSCEPTDVNATVSALAPTMHQALGEHVRLELALGPTAPLVALDAAGFEQILTVLCAQARDAMPQGGTVTVRTEHVYGTSRVGPTPARGTAGDYLRLSVEDTGRGFDPALAERLFEPFYMKRRLGRGRGLEPAVVHRLVEQHGGFIEVDTAPDRGTAFHLYFPRHNTQGGTRG